MDNFENDIAGYLKELETQSPIVSTSHTTLLKLWRKYGKERVENYLEEFFNKGKNGINRKTEPCVG